jgi:hypothetical protein
MTDDDWNVLAAFKEVLDNFHHMITTFYARVCVEDWETILEGARIRLYSKIRMQL